MLLQCPNNHEEQKQNHRVCRGVMAKTTARGAELVPPAAGVASWQNSRSGTKVPASEENVAYVTPPNIKANKLQSMHFYVRVLGSIHISMTTSGLFLIKLFSRGSGG